MGSSWAIPLGNGNKPNARNYRRRGSEPTGRDDGNKDDDDDESLSLVKVSCRDQWYQVHHVTTVSDLLQDVQRQSSSLNAKDLQTAKLLYRGRVLEKPNDKLKEYGIRDGDTIFMVTENYRFRPHEVLAIFLEMMAREDDGVGSPLAKLFAHFQEHGIPNYFHQTWDTTGSPRPNLQRDQISHFIRAAIDLGYHRIRLFWERPSFRQALANPVPMEAYRLVIANHLPPSIQKELSPSTKQLLENPQVWRKQLLKWTEAFLRLGDLVLDGLLDIVLDVVQGAGTRSTGTGTGTTTGNSALSSQFSTSSRSSPNHDHYEPTMEDPFMANQMLFELSESEDD